MPGSTMGSDTREGNGPLSAVLKLRSSGTVTLGVTALLSALLAACGSGQTGEPGRPPLEARAAVDRTSATTGDLIAYQLEVEYDESYQVEVPPLGDEIGGLRVYNQESSVKSRRGRTTLSFSYLLRADLVGSYTLPTVSVSFVGPDGEAASIESDEIQIEVESVLPADQEVTDIHDVKPLRALSREASWLWFVVAVVIVALALGFWWLWRRSRSRGQIAPALPAHEVALQALGRLRESDLSDPQQLKRYYFGLSIVVREYVEARFDLNATDLTTEEIESRLSALSNLAQSEARALHSFLASTDQVKYAKVVPTLPEAQASHGAAVAFVEATKQIERETTSAGTPSSAPGSLIESGQGSDDGGSSMSGVGSVKRGAAEMGR